MGGVPLPFRGELEDAGDAGAPGGEDVRARVEADAVLGADGRVVGVEVVEVAVADGCAGRGARPRVREQMGGGTPGDAQGKTWWRVW
mmetsp:Transcript_18529/g.60055  ORF Transcript_18529/g.60055 Transcript_18529/m.60055 type:complete len:87 (+) Transcript_18529:11-271(+)